MSLSLIWPAGLAFGEILHSDDMELLDASQAKAVDGVGGGTYAPSTKIIINGAGLQTNSLTVTGTLSLLGNTTIGNAPTEALSVLATSTFSSPVTLNDPLTANDTADFWANVTIHSATVFNAAGDVLLGLDATKTLTVAATANFNAPLTANDTVDIWGDLTAHSATTANLAGNVSLGNDSSKRLTIGAALINALSFDDDGRVPSSNGGVLPNQDATLTAGQGQIWRINPSATGYWQYTLSTSGVGDGDWMLFWQGSGNGSVSAHGAKIVSPTSGQSTAGDLFTGKNSQFALYVYQNGWYLALSSTFI